MNYWAGRPGAGGDSRKGRSLVQWGEARRYELRDPSRLSDLRRELTAAHRDSRMRRDQRDQDQAAFYQRTRRRPSLCCRGPDSRHNSADDKLLAVPSAV